MRAFVVLGRVFTRVLGAPLEAESLDLDVFGSLFGLVADEAQTFGVLVVTLVVVASAQSFALLVTLTLVLLVVLFVVLPVVRLRLASIFLAAFKPRPLLVTNKLDYRLLFPAFDGTVEGKSSTVQLNPNAFSFGIRMRFRLSEQLNSFVNFTMRAGARCVSTGDFDGLNADGSVAASSEVMFLSDGAYCPSN